MSNEDTDHTSIFRRTYKYWIKGIVVGLVVASLLSPWLSLGFTKLYTPWAPTYSSPDIEIELNEIEDERKNGILDENNITNSRSVDVYHLKIDNQAERAAEDVNLLLPLPGCIVAKDMSLNRKVGVDNYRVNNITPIRQTSGDWSKFRTMSCSEDIHIEELDANDIFHIQYITTTDLEKCDVLYGPGSESKYRISYEWVSHGHRLDKGPTFHRSNSLDSQFDNFWGEIKNHNTTEYRQENVRAIFIGLNRDYNAHSLPEFTKAMSLSEC